MPGQKRTKWKVSVELNGAAFQVSVPVASASSPAELKQSIAEVCLVNLGPGVTPVQWLEGHTDTLAVQYLDRASGAAKTMKPHTSISDLAASRTLRVTMRGTRINRL